MGLSASQARLLTITSRKSDCEFQSMRLSHEKIALSRSMTDISNEYQNALDQTKLVYDFYGTNDKSMDVTYGLLMQPSELNGYMPIVTTDATGKVVLDSKYAAAARAAGIPTEGLGCLPSDLLRNRFLDSLADNAIITPAACTNYKQINYSQTVGMGDTDVIDEVVQEMTFAEMLENYFKDINVNLANGIMDPNYRQDQPDLDTMRILIGSTDEGNYTNVSLSDILKGDEQYTLVYKALSDARWNANQVQFNGLSVMSNWWTVDGEGKYMLDVLRNALSTSDPATQTAIAYADTKINEMLNQESILTGDFAPGGSVVQGSIVATNLGGGNDRFAYDTDMSLAGTSKNNNREAARMFVSDATIANNAKNFIGYYSRTTRMNTDATDNESKRAQYETLSINIGNVLKAYLTYFADAMSDFSGQYYVDKTAGTLSIARNSGHLVASHSNSRSVAESKLVGTRSSGSPSEYDFKFNVVTSKDINTSDALMSSFYDAMFNQICTRGWVENDNVNDKEYLQDMFKNGMMFVTAASDDGFYYQNNYGSFSYIKEVADDEAIARAEAKYNTEKAKLNHKEEMLDLKMKNLDTEISSLTTEYDTIKSLISKNIERGFKRYDA